MWLTDDEFEELLAELRAAMASRMEHRPAAGRRRRVLSTVLLPGEPDGPRRE
jgi:hypothetical protein